MDASSKSSVRLKQEKNINLSKCGGAIQKDLDTWEECEKTQKPHEIQQGQILSPAPRMAGLTHQGSWSSAVSQ